jgi:hypothetical protein
MPCCPELHNLPGEPYQNRRCVLATTIERHAPSNQRVACPKLSGPSDWRHFRTDPLQSGDYIRSIHAKVNI